MECQPTTGRLDFAKQDILLPLAEVERKYITFALEKCEGNYTKTSRVLGIALSTLKRKLKSYRLR